MSKSEVAELREFLDKSKADLVEIRTREEGVFNLHSPGITRDFYSKKIRLICNTCQPKGENRERIDPAVPWPCETVRTILDPVCFAVTRPSDANDVEPGES